MAADAYVSKAVSELHDAVAEINDEIRRAREQIYDHEHRTNGDLSHAEYDRTTTQTELRAQESLNNGVRRGELLARVEQLNRQINDKKQEVKQKEQATDDFIRAKTDLINRLQTLASQLQSLQSAAR